MKLSNIPTSKPRQLRTDDYIIEVYPSDGIIKFWLVGVHLGEVVKKGKSPKFTLKVKKFANYKTEYKTLLGFMTQFVEGL